MRNCHRDTTDMQPYTFARYVTKEYYHQVLGLSEVWKEEHMACI